MVSVRFLFGFFVLVWATPLQAATEAIEMVFVGGKGKVDYVAVGEKPFESLAPFNTTRNLDSFVIKYRGWSLLGEYVYRAEFYYALNRGALTGAKGPVNFAQIKKYPDLAKRYEAIRPSSVNFVLRARVTTESRSKDMAFKVTDNDLVYFGSRSGQNFATPGSPPRWKDAVTFDTMHAFTTNDPTTDAELKKFLVGLRSVSVLPPDVGVDVLLEVKWPDREIDRIGELYGQYEKEGEKLKEDYAFLDDAPRAQPFAGPREQAEPHDFRLQPGEFFREGKEVGLKVNGQVVFRSTRHDYAREFDSRKTFFFFRMKGGLDEEIYDTKGRQVKVGGYARVSGFKPSRRGTPQVIGRPDTRSVVYRTRLEYSGLFEGLTQSEFDDFTRRDSAPPPPQPPRVVPRGVQGVVIALPTYFYEFERAELLELDEKLNVLSRQPLYFPRFIR